MLGLHAKVQNAGLAGAITVVVVWAVKTFAHQDIPAEVASALTFITMSVTGYSSKSDTQ